MHILSSYSTGNEYISLDNIETQDASIKNITMLHMNSKGLLDFRGEKAPLLKVEIKVDNKLIDITDIHWNLINYWIPKAIIETNNEIIQIIILTPIKQKGFIYHISITNKTNKKRNYEVSIKGELNSLYHCVNEEMYFNGKYEAFHSSWSDGPIISISNGFPIIALAPLLSKKSTWDYTKSLPIKYISKTIIEIENYQSDEIDFFMGVGYEQVSAVTAALEMKRQTFNFLLKEMTDYLNKIVKHTKNQDFNSLLNRNLIYTLFYSTGLTIDTEERVIVTSRSPKYYVSAAYWDRDSLLWAFPSIVNADALVAKEIIEYIATKQSKNIGIHSRFIDGTILEPGFELDELCSFPIALNYYIEITKNKSILEDPHVIKLINNILDILETKKSEKLGLYETFLQPTDDMRVYPYLTYNNVLVWKLYKILETWDFANNKEIYKQKAFEVYASIYTHCVKTINNNKQFIWSVDENDNFDIYDEPPGSLILLPSFNFISKDNMIYKNTINKILDKSYQYSFSNTPFAAIGCPHAPHPWILSLANNIRIFHDMDSINKLLKAKMDNGIACESIDEYTGECTTGEAFATCAGYLAFSLIGEIGQFL
ncbi:MAG: glycoside hydrolase family 125 protein [Pleomorphochaeta sp.]